MKRTIIIGFKCCFIIGLLILSIGFLFYGCKGKTTSHSNGNGNTVPNDKKLVSADTSLPIPGESTDPVILISDKDIFTPPEMRPAHTAPNSIPVEEKIELQQLTITGLVFDGKQYLVSIENQETSETNYLKVNDSISGYRIVAIDFNQIQVRSAEKTRTYQVGDRLPLLGTRSSVGRSRSISNDTTELIESSGENNAGEAPPALSPAKDGSTSLTINSFEEILRQRRLKQEEELK